MCCRNMKEIIIFVLIFLIVVFGIKVNPVQAYLDGTLIRAVGYNEVYVLENGLKRWITNPNVFNNLGYKWSNVLIVSKATIDNCVSGNDLSSDYYYPDGSLIRGEGPKVYLIEAGKKRWIPNPQIFEAKGFRWEKIIKVNDYTLRNISRGADIVLEKENLRPSTFIIEGPCRPGQDKIPTIDSTEASFKFSGHNPTGPDKDLSFETYVQGYDQRWQSTYAYQRKINLEPSSEPYTFYVRAKNRAGYYDNSPVFCKFKTKISSYKDKININSVSGWGDNPQYESMSIGTSYYLKEPVNITGWVIKTNKRRFVIPQAVKSLHPNSIYNFKRDIYLNAGERITIYGGQSPIVENAFALNKCWWWIDDAKKYEDCYYDHNQDHDFLTGEWRVYLNRATEMFDDKDEKVILLDKNNLVVDSYSYYIW